ncbi:hypothetical protein M514_17776 [Trichuris suis]|uniref:Peptidase S1 domain-containing protein n=1 Tax=Trichuris suis TaxID=68888 RepID=A0A085NKC1_9BILA|nr:hypothetical protein M514_17776 [Trichuris suis]
MPVCLPRPNKGPPEGAQCFISGWGRTVSDGSLSSTLQVIDVKILKKNRCNLVGEAKTKSLCAGNMKGGKDACQGDSGGPLVCIVKDRFVLYGITSFGVGCGQRKQPGVYVEVARREMRSERDIEVVLGAHNVHIPEERRVISAVSQYTLAPRYDPNTNGEDVALLQLRDTIDFTDAIMPVCLPKQHDPLPEDVFCYISGWGSTVYGGSASYTLRVVDVNILDEGYCDMNPQTKSNSFCAGHKEGKKDACQEVESTHYVECGSPKHSFIRNGGNRIVGGWDAVPHSVPWQVRLYLYDNDRPDGSCGGSLVRLAPGNQTRKEYRSPDDIEVVVGAHNFQFYEPDRVVSRVDKFTHGQYSHKTKRLDIALVQLRRTITFTDTIMPVCLPRSPVQMFMSCHDFCFNFSVVLGGSPSYTLRVVDVKILEDEDCNIDNETKAKSFCAGHKEGRKDACQGDSGGPLVCIVNDRFFLYGITSYGEGCGQPGKPGVYSEVAQYIHWIKRQARIFESDFDLFTESIYQHQVQVRVESVSSELY